LKAYLDFQIPRKGIHYWSRIMSVCIDLSIDQVDHVTENLSWWIVAALSLGMLKPFGSTLVNEGLDRNVVVPLWVPAQDGQMGARRCNRCDSTSLYLNVYRCLPLSSFYKRS
jgi:hypothetical protein